MTEAMADIAFIFHWGEADVMAMPASRILMWRDKAVSRWNQTHGQSE